MTGVTGQTIVNAALQEHNLVGIADAPAGGPMAQFVLEKLNRLIDNWNAERALVYDIGFASYTLTPNHQPHLIGPGLVAPDFAVTQRPVTVDGANLVLTTVTPNIRQPLDLVDDDWWRTNRVQGLTSPMPTALYYSPAWPNGELFLWPVPTTAYQLELQTRTVLATVALATPINLPPGYQDAITLTLAEDIASAFGQVISPKLEQNALRARARIMAVNDGTPRLQTRDAGMPGRRGGGYNYRTGLNT